MILYRIRKQMSGQSAVELAIGGGVFLVVLIAFLQFGVIFYKQAWMDHVAREAAREAAVMTSGNYNNLSDSVKDRLSGAGFDESLVNVTINSIDDNEKIQVNITYPQPTIPIATLFQDSNSINLEANAWAYNESKVR